MMYRIEKMEGHQLDRRQTLRFRFEGQAYIGFAGDTISSALAACGVMILGRSFKYHRPRGILSFANHDANVLFNVDGVPNVRGDIEPLRDGMKITAVNTFGGLAHDRGHVLDRLGAFLPVGFYYKAFHGRLFPRWERMFRRLSGLGVVSPSAPRKRTAKRYAFCDVLVIGSGPSGLSAALSAANAGAQVLLVEEATRPGGSGNWASQRQRDTSGSGSQLLSAIQQTPRIKVQCSTYAAGYYADQWIALASHDYLTKVRASAVVFATGVIEQPAVFRNNDLPGVMLASAARRLLNLYCVAPGRRVVIVGANLEAYATCLDLLSNSVQVVALVDMRRSGERHDLSDVVKARNIRVLTGWSPIEAHGDRAGILNALTVAPSEGHGKGALRGGEKIPCDAVLMSVGWASALQLPQQNGATVRFDESLQQFLPMNLPEGAFIAGRANGVYGWNERVEDGAHAGARAANHAGFAVPVPPAPAREQRRPSHLFPIIDHPKARNFVDFDEDLQVKDLQNAIQEGFDSVELLKRFSTVGMGPSQGKHSNVHAVRILAAERGMSIERAGHTTSRPMYHPVALKLLAGRGMQVERRTPIDKRHEQHGAVWMLAGNWRRPEYYRVRGEADRAANITAEVHAVRTAVGLIDVGTLGKIEIHGPDAGEFLDRVYATRCSDLRVGMTRYGLMLDEAGTIVDDGVIARLEQQSFYFTTTTGGSAPVYRELQRLNAQWGLNCALVNITGHRAAFNLAGPLSRSVLQAVCAIDLDTKAFPYLAVREGSVAGAPARLMRVGFVGELGYEIHVPFSLALHVWNALLDAGREHQIRPFGVEAQRQLRLEKGHLIIGQDTDGLTNPTEANAGWAVKMDKPFFIGQRSLRILDARGIRHKLVGFELKDENVLPRECCLVIDREAIAGRITSIARSATVNKVIGLAMVRTDLATPGTLITIRNDDGRLLKAQIVATPFYDPTGAKQKSEAAS